MQVELFLLILSTRFFASILAGKAGSRFGVPALLLFLGVGMLSMFLTLGLLVNPSELRESAATTICMGYSCLRSFSAKTFLWHGTMKYGHSSFRR